MKTPLPPSIHLHFGLPPPLPYPYLHRIYVPCQPFCPHSFYTYVQTIFAHPPPLYQLHPSSIYTSPLFFHFLSYQSSQFIYRSQTFHLKDVETFSRPSTYHPCFTPIQYRR